MKFHGSIDSITMLSFRCIKITIPRMPDLSWSPSTTENWSQLRTSKQWLTSALKICGQCFMKRSSLLICQRGRREKEKKKVPCIIRFVSLLIGMHHANTKRQNCFDDFLGVNKTLCHETMKIKFHEGASSPTVPPPMKKILIFFSSVQMCLRVVREWYFWSKGYILSH